MIYRIALSSTDGIVVNCHFGHSKRFLIAEIDTETGSYRFEEPRNVTPCCSDRDHTDSSIDAVLEVLSDVQAVMVCKIGTEAAHYLEHKGMAVYEAPYPINELIEKIIAEKIWEADKWQYLTKN
ncbi:MAG: NifB/NifX family molybdenum-iron cluster-binding protein [Huintestinicola sp.]